MSIAARRTVVVDDVTLSVLEAGPTDGPLVVLLHGFPEHAGSWEGQIARLAGAGLRVAAPDQRGYGLSGKPTDVAAYRLDRLADDVVDLAAALGHSRFSVVGHDWGGLVAWWVAATRRDRIERVAVLNAPHPAIVRRFMGRHPSQLLRSWYVGFFQIPGVPEWVLSRHGHAAMARAMAGSARPGLFGPAAMRRYGEEWSRPGALTGMVNWYRALIRFPPRAHDPRVTCPCRVLWGGRDRFLDRALADASLALCTEGSIARFDACTHWLHHEEPEAVGRELVAFLARQPG